LDDACWDGATLELGGIEFETGGRDWSDWEHDQGRFLLLKEPQLLKAYAQFWSDRTMPRNVVELGVWEGGSPAFWFEVFAPEKHVAIDRIDREDSEHFSSYVRRRGAADRLKTYWGVDQGDRTALREIVTREFDGPIDLVIDDASHIYGPTRASFEILFPQLRPGGLYIIEDWQWSLVDEPPASLANEEPASRLVHEALDSVGRGGESVQSVTVLHGFAVIEKGQTWHPGYPHLWRDVQGGRLPSPASVEELRSFLLAQDGLRDATMVSVLAYAGLRPRELLTLRWSDVTTRFLRVAGAQVNDIRQSARRVRLFEPLAEDLALWRESCDDAGKGALVFPPDTGARWDPDQWIAWREQVFTPAVGSCYMEGLKPMQLRTTFCCLLLLEGMTGRTIAHQMGTTTEEAGESYERLRLIVVGGLETWVSAEAKIREARGVGSTGDDEPPWEVFGEIAEDVRRWRNQR
jgi:hypothetical protein